MERRRVDVREYIKRIAARTYPLIREGIREILKARSD